MGRTRQCDGEPTQDKLGSVAQSDPKRSAAQRRGSQTVDALHRTERSLRGRLGDRDQILATAVHDLRNALQGILLNAQMIQKMVAGERANDLGILALAASMEESTKRMSALIENLLEADRPTRSRATLMKPAAARSARNRSLCEAE